jgi:hypothetical protein
MIVRPGFIDSIGNTPPIAARHFRADGPRHLRHGRLPRSWRLGQGPGGAANYRGRRKEWQATGQAL